MRITYYSNKEIMGNNLEMNIEYMMFNFVTDVLKTNKNINSEENKDLFFKYMKDYRNRKQKLRIEKLNILGI